MVNLIERAKALQKSQEEVKNIISDAMAKTPRKKKEVLTPIEKTLMGKVFQAYLKQYPLVSKGKKPDKYAFNHKMVAFLKEKLLRMKLMQEVKP